MKFLSFLGVVFFLFSSCSDYSRLQKSTDLDKKYEAAVVYFNKGDYVKSSTLLEELLSVYKGTAKGENVSYYYAQSIFEMGDYTLAGYYFKSFVRSYPQSAKAEECAYLHAYCYYLNSPTYSLDQTDTKEAIKEFQLFINNYPNSERLKECNELIDKLRGKLEQKYYEISKQYHHISDYKAAIQALNNTLKEFPDSKYKEEMLFLMLESSYLLAINSIETKKLERFDSTIDIYLKFVDTFAKGTYAKKAEGIYENSLKEKQKVKS